ncbi:MAG: PIG-L family deacetylase [Chloroflexi bacterium]|nr:PIG-L family deacetylase [Chloroflexota bacterium]
MEGFVPTQRVLVVAPHPDDAEVGCAGTVARFVQEGAEVYYLIATNGDKGTEDPTLTSADLARTREAEQRAAATILGVKEVTILPHGDGELEEDRATIGEVVHHIRRIRPDIVLTTDPYRTTFYIHRDHVNIGLVTMHAVFPFARDRLHFPEHFAAGLAPHKTTELYFWGTETADLFVDITDTIDLKIRASQAHSSQFGDDVDRWVRRWSARIGKGQGMAFAESFRTYGISRMGRDFNDDEEQA